MGTDLNGNAGETLMEDTLRMSAGHRPPRRALAVVCLLGLLVLAGCAATDSTPRNVIFLIGDGMGLTHITAAKVDLGELAMERMPVVGLQTTFPTGAFITDSAASGTALATGERTHNGKISMTPDYRSVPTVLEVAEGRGMATGLISTSSITHATPAVFASHVDDRDKELEIASQMIESGVDVLIGGGAGYFLPLGESGGRRRDGRDLLNEVGERVTVVRTAGELLNTGEVDGLVALLAPGHMPAAPERTPPLSVMTAKAIEVLGRNRDGFFLMVEGSQIDWAGHENDQEWLLAEMTDFDAAVAAALDFAERDGRTLVIVTADHECGGLSLTDGSVSAREVTEVSWGSDTHTATMVPVFAFGPGSARFAGTMNNTDIGRRLIELVTPQ